jgi:SAM-dependent methyltransferase
MAKKQKTKKRKNAWKTQAQQADKHELYEKSVQQPEEDVSLVSRIYKKRFDKPAHTMREDFCGTAVFAYEWVRRHAENRAWGIDLDPEPLEWGRARHGPKLDEAQSQRLALIQGDVLEVRHDPVDVTVAFNFSYFLFNTRETLRNYFEVARKTLQEDGLFLIDVYGGGEAQKPQEEKREVDGGFTYVWDQHEFEPIHHKVTNFIHFEFEDGSRMRRAFRYDWRLWTLPELRELLAEAGFRDIEVYWEGTDGDTGEGNGIFRLCERAPEDPAWICYIAAYR